MSLGKRHCVPDFVATLRINLAIDIWRPPVKSILVKNSPRVYTALEPNPGEGRTRTPPAPHSQEGLEGKQE